VIIAGVLIIAVESFWLTDVTIYQVKTEPQLVTFTRWLVGDLRTGWGKILTEVENLHLVNGRDLVQRKFGCNGHFSVKSVYQAMTASEPGSYTKTCGKGRLSHPKISNFGLCIENTK
jgi:hypothetical protein